MAYAELSRAVGRTATQGSSPRSSFLTEVLEEGMGSAVCRRPIRRGTAGELGGPGWRPRTSR